MNEKKRKPIGLIIGLAVGIPLSILFTIFFIIVIVAIFSPDESEIEYSEETEDYEFVEDEEDLVSEEENDETWAIYWYLCGTDLESEEGLATDNVGDAFAASDYADKPENVTFVIEAGGCRQWHNGNFSNDCLTRMVSHGKDYEIVERTELSNMGEADTLADFLTFCNDNYPADHKMVLFWDHGGGTLEGACCDELYDMDSLGIDEIYEAFAKSGELSSDNPPYDIVGFDCCLMSTLDVANVLSDVAEYMIASEEYEPGCGWNYYSWAGELANNPNMTPEELGRIICSSYIELCNEIEPENNSTLALLDLRKITPVLEAYDAVGLSAIKLTAEDSFFFTDFARTIGTTKGFGGESEAEGMSNLVDLGDFAGKIKDRVPEASDLLNALDSMVVYNATGKRAGNATGLSFYYNSGGDETDLKEFLRLGAGSSFKYFYSLGMTEDMTEEGMAYLADNGIAPSDIPSIQTLNSFGMDEVPLLYDEERGLYYADVGSEISEYITDVKYEMFYIDPESDLLLFLGYDDEIECDWDNGRFYDDISGCWGTLEGIPVFMDLVYASDDYNEYSVAIDVHGLDAVLKVYYDFSDQTWTIGDAYYVSPDGIPTKNTLELEDGEEVGIVCYAASVYEDDDFESYIMDTFTYSDDLCFDTEPLEDGEYALVFEMSDALNNTIYSDFLYFYIEGDVIYYDME